MTSELSKIEDPQMPDIPAVVEGDDDATPEEPAQAVTTPWWHARKWAVVQLIISLVLLGTFWAGSRPAPYALLSAGPTIDVSSGVESSRARLYKSTGEIRLVTVFVSSSNWREYVWSKMPWSDTGSLKVDLSPTNREASQADMTSSHDTAAMIAEQYVFGSLKSMKPAGAVVLDSLFGGPAQSAGVLTGDVILKVNGESVLTAADVVAAVSGKTVSVELSRDGTTQEIDIPLKNGKIGVVVSNYYSGEPLINTFTAEVGGASAGLAMTLAFIDSLTPGDLTNGDHLAATGVIMPDGSIGMVDGVQYKARGAARDGATLLLVPKGNKETVKNPSLPLYEVSTIQEAVDFLCDRGSNDAICEMGNS